MTENDINIVKLKFLEGIIEPFVDVLARKTNSIDFEVRNFPENLCGDHKIFSRNIESLKCNSKLFFTFTESIDLSSVKEVDSKLVSFLDKISSSLLPSWVI